MSRLSIQFWAPLRGCKTVDMIVSKGHTAEEVARKAVEIACRKYGFGMRPGMLDGLQCMAISNGRVIYGEWRFTRAQRRAQRL